MVGPVGSIWETLVAVSRSAKNAGLLPFVSIMPYFGSHDAAFC
jgi:hypothetical protein